MSEPDTPSDRMKRLDAKLAETRRRRAPAPQAPRGGKFAGAELAWRLTIELIAGIAVGAGMGWGLDSLFGTMPVFFILMTLMGFGAGVRLMLQTARQDQQDKARTASAAGGDKGAAAPQNEGR